MPDRSAENLRRLAPAEIHQLAFGVRYEPQFKVMDHIGTVIDEILRADGTPFGQDTFPLTDQTPQQYRLISDQTNSWLLISAQDTVLQIEVNTKNESRVDELASGFQDYVLRLLRKVGVKNIVRYGVMFRFQEEDMKLFQNPPIKRFLSPELPNANAMVMHFTRRLPVEEALAKKRVNDFRNAIYSVRQSESGKVQFSIDYQEYFDPLLDAADWDARPFPRFVGQGTEYVHGEFYKWLQKFMAVAEVA
jgi:hypothetical protein